MAYKIAVSHLNASTVDIINAIRQNAPAEYQSKVPALEKDSASLRKVGDVICGYPAFSNYFLNELVNRIAFVNIKSATFNNAYAELKKGYLEFGETVEEVFVEIAKAREFSAEKAYSRELKRTLPDVRTAFHCMNWRVQYPVTIQDEDLRQAFMSINGVQDLIAKIVDAVYTAAEYDEYLLFKYLMIKAIAHGKMYPVAVDSAVYTNAAVAFRGASNMLTFVNTKYNASGVHTSTPKNDQYIFMDAMYNASYDVNVLASAFNMDKAEFQGKLKLIDSWDTFDNDRFSVIMENSDMIEPVTEDELLLMKDVKAVLVDGEWFQVYDNNNKFTETYVSSGMYWNYNYNVWKTVSSSPFSNAVVFIDSAVPSELPQSFTVEVADKSMSENAIVLTLNVQDDDAGFHSTEANFVQTQSATEQGIGVHKYGAVMFPKGAGSFTLEMNVKGTKYTSTVACTGAATTGTTYTMQLTDGGVGIDDGDTD